MAGDSWFYFLMIEVILYQDRAVSTGKPRCNRSIRTFGFGSVKFRVNPWLKCLFLIACNSGFPAFAENDGEGAGIMGSSTGSLPVKIPGPELAEGRAFVRRPLYF